jgi:DNA-binding NarL/FixJ family response regulator
MKTIHILIIDDHPMVIEGLKALLRNLNYLESIHQANSAQAGLRILENGKVDIALIDIQLPDMSGIELCKVVHQRFPKVKILGMSSHADPTYANAMVHNGANGFFNKVAGLEEIEKAILGALQNQITISIPDQNLPQIKTTHLEKPILTRREMEVLEWIAKGLTNKEIAEKLFVSTNTVDTHRKNLLAKFDVLNTAALVYQAGKVGLV